MKYLAFIPSIVAAFGHENHLGTNKSEQNPTHQHVSISKELLGQGDWKFNIISNAIKLPDQHHKPVQDYHGVAVDSLGRVYIGYYSRKSTAETRAVARFIYQPDKTPVFKLDKFIGDKSWNDGRLHGLNIVKIDGKEKLLLVYNKKKVILADLDGNLEKGWKMESNKFRKASDGHLSPKGKQVAVFDGYSSNVLYGLDKKTGKLTGATSGGRGKGNGKTSTAHGLGVDPDGNYVVADRGNKRLLWWTPDLKPLMIKDKDGKLKQKQLAMPGLEVCNVAFEGKYAVVPSLNASIAIIGPDDSSESGYKIISKFKIPAEYVKLGYDGIHDANFTKDFKYIVVSTWQRKRNVAPCLFLLKREVRNE